MMGRKKLLEMVIFLQADDVRDPQVDFVAPADHLVSDKDIGKDSIHLAEYRAGVFHLHIKDDDCAVMLEVIVHAECCGGIFAASRPAKEYRRVITIFEHFSPAFRQAYQPVIVYCRVN